MHLYVSDSKERRLVPFCVAAVSILAAWCIKSALGKWQINLPWWIDAPSVIGLYGLFYAIFDNFFWKFLHRIRVVKVPNLNGTWKGHVASSFDKHATKYNATIKVSQKWSEISIVLDTDNSKSHSLSASIITKDTADPVLAYEYLNEPKPTAKSTMHTHRGTARLTIDVNSNSLEGEYYTGRDRMSIGTLKFKRQKV